MNTPESSNAGSTGQLTPRKIAGYGWRPDLPDHRDFMWHHHRPAMDPDVMAQACSLPPQFQPPIYDQGDLGSCTGNALAANVQYGRAKLGLPALGPSGIPSRLMIYYEERAIEGSIDSDSGAEIRDGIKVLATLGVCDESEWPYNIAAFTQRAPDTCYTDAAQHLVSQYMNIRMVEADLMAAIVQGYMVTFGFSVYESFESASVAQTGNAPMPGPNEQLLGGHAVDLIGYDRPNVWICRNSWGEGWGKSGTFTLPWLYLLDDNLASDFWAMEVFTG